MLTPFDFLNAAQIALFSENRFLYMLIANHEIAKIRAKAQYDFRKFKKEHLALILSPIDPNRLKLITNYDNKNSMLRYFITLQGVNSTPARNSIFAPFDQIPLYKWGNRIDYLCRAYPHLRKNEDNSKIVLD